MNKLTICLVLISCSLGVNAQTQSATLDYNNTRTMILNGGDFFWNLNNARYVVPKNTDLNSVTKSTIFSGAIWLGAEEEDGTKHLSAMTYRQRGNDFWPGPHSSDTTATRTKYDKIYEVSATEVAAHKNNSTNPAASILEWPGNGDTTKGEPYHLAPFVDINKNGKYEPALGDYPKIKGTGAAYCVYSDQGIHTESGGIPLGVDVHQLFFQDVATGFEEVNLASFIVINRSDIVYKKFKFGVYIDFDLGNFSDDFVGCDSATNMIYAYNGDDDDEGILGYGFNPPSQNMMFLNTDMGAAVYYNNNANPVNGNPVTEQDFYYYLDGRLKGGTRMNYGGDGLTGDKTNYYLSGDPVSGTGWTESQAGNVPADRRMLAVAEETSLAKGEVKCYDIAFVYGRATSGDATASITTMKTKAAAVQLAYDNNTYNWQSSKCSVGAQDAETAGILGNRTSSLSFNVYPNPSTGKFTIKGLKTDKPSVITNLAGQTLKTIEANTRTTDLSEFETVLLTDRSGVCEVDKAVVLTDKKWRAVNYIYSPFLYKTIFYSYI